MTPECFCAKSRLQVVHVNRSNTPPCNFNHSLPQVKVVLKQRCVDRRHVKLLLMVTSGSVRKEAKKLFQVKTVNARGTDTRINCFDLYSKRFEQHRLYAKRLRVKS